MHKASIGQVLILAFLKLYKDSNRGLLVLTFVKILLSLIIVVEFFLHSPVFLIINNNNNNAPWRLFRCVPPRHESEISIGSI
jgi:hypothetical protein